MTALLVILAIALLLLALGLLAAVRASGETRDTLTAAHDQSTKTLEAALDHADTRRREAEQRAGQAEAEVLALRQERDESAYAHLLGRQVVIQRTDGEAISGVLERYYRDALALSHPKLVRGDQALGGEYLIPHDQRAGIQAFDETAEQA